MTRVHKNRNPASAKRHAWALKCKTCAQHSPYSEYDQKPLAHNGKVIRQAARARCPKCGAENEYLADDLQLIEREMEGIQ
jgi:Zn finger protein HypA/HybF involved in hydrogenase expression